MDIEIKVRPLDGPSPAHGHSARRGLFATLANGWPGDCGDQHSEPEGAVKCLQRRIQEKA